MVFTMNRAHLEQWAAAADTSVEIAQAIHEVAGHEPYGPWSDDWDEEYPYLWDAPPRYERARAADRIWADPTYAEERQVVRRAFELAGEGVDTLYWGCEVCHRPPA